jgi:hypothetical protein
MSAAALPVGFPPTGYFPIATQSYAGISENNTGNVAYEHYATGA